MNWKKLFSKTILDRGYNYYCSRTVENLDCSDNVIYASVSGSEDYEVEISLSDNDIEDMYCSCPYASDGTNCKHMAAVLYAWEENVRYSNTAKNTEDILFKPAYTSQSRKVKRTEIEKLIAGAKTDDIRSFLAEILTENEKLCLHFYNTVNKKHKNQGVQDYIRQIDLTVRQYMGKDNFINYNEAPEFVAELEEIIYNDLSPMIDNGNYMNAFEIANYIFGVITNVDIDDSDGIIVTIADNICQIWSEIINAAKPCEKRKLFEWFIAHSNSSNADFLEDYADQILTINFNENEFVQDKLTFFRSMINRSEQFEQEWRRDYSVRKWTARYLQLLINTNPSDEKIEEELKSYRKNPDTRKLYVDICLQKKEYDKAIELLDEGLKEDKKHYMLISEYSNKKKEIYLMTGNREAYIKQLWSLVLEHDVGNMELYRELRKQYSKEEWHELREKVFQKLPKHIEISKYYNEEKLYDRLLECVLKSHGLYLLNKYENVLKKQYTKQLLGKYKMELDKIASTTGTRKQYADMVSVMRKMNKLSGGTELVNQMAAEWRIKYRNRPAMMDELSKL